MPVRATGTGKLLRAWSAAIENRAALDRPANLLGAAADLLTKSPPFCRALRGEWLGHALHPLMTDFPLGAWMSASLLDLFGPPQSREASGTSFEPLVAWRHSRPLPREWPISPERKPPPDELEHFMPP
jgi:hypothetical protein